MFVYVETYLVLLGLFATIFLQIKWLNSGLQLFPSVVIVPTFQSFWILISVLSGMMFFGTHDLCCLTAVILWLTIRSFSDNLFA